MVVDCVCCGIRVDSTSRRPFHGTAMRLFVSARINMSLPTSGFICNTCRMSYLRWRGNREFAQAFDRIEVMPNETIDGNENTVRFSLVLLIIYSYFYLE